MRTLITAATVAMIAGTAMAQNIGPSTTTSPYVVPTAAGVSTTSILTVGDTIGGYRLVGIPDGMGLIDNGNGSFDLLVNHELGATAGAVRAHGSAGAFVSRWNMSTGLTVNSGRDHNTSAADVRLWNGTGYTPGTTAFNRFCSADLAKQSAYQFGNLGTSAKLFMNGEESGAEGRAFAHIVSGPNMNTTYQLPALGRFSWENSVASPKAQAKTIVAGMDDSTTNGQVYFYVGTKTDSGNEVERAGLTNGRLMGVKVDGLASELRTGVPAANTRFSLFDHGDVTNTTGAALNTASVNAQVTNFLRPEDGSWDARAGYEKDFYFVTTDRFDQAGQVGRSRLWKMTFDNIENPEAGGTITALLDGTSGPQMMDNICVDKFGRILIQEDIGGNNALGKVWLYDIASGGLIEVARHDAARFAPGAPGFLTNDEESSGIIDASDTLGDGWYLMNVQAHYGIAGELVEGGQLVAMYVDPSIVPAPGALGLLGVGGLVAMRRRRA